MKVKKLLLIAIATVAGIVSYGQDMRKSEKNDKKSEKRERINALSKLEEENEPAFKKQSVFGAKLNSDGYGISFEIGKYKTPKLTTLYMFEFNEKFHPKEEKQAASSDVLGNVSQFKYGKANNFYQFKLGYGQQRLIGGKANKNGVAVSSIYAGGISVGLLKPYYVDVIDQNTNENLEYKFSDTLPSGSTYNILGASGFTKGWGELKVKPGVHAKAALRFDYGRFNEMVSAIEAGLNVEYYTSDIVQMIEYQGNKDFSVKKNNLFFNAYIAIHFGRRK
jgi:hypothetical protein